ncbi:MAG: acetate/propionate family kinase [Solirubrobacteraceae bacterium]
MRVLVVNAGSSSLKLALLDADDSILVACELRAPDALFEQTELEAALRSPLGEADAVGHRIVHGGERYREAVRIDAGVREQLDRLTDLAPLHQPKSLAALDAVGRALPRLPAVACFDTAFHATIPPAAATYALPAGWRERWGLRRYGFHGLSHAWVARRAPALLGLDPAAVRVVSAHLGAGASLCAIGGGRSLDTTMGFTPLEGLVMATRSGSLDPGMLLWLIDHEQLSAPELAEVLEHRSGLLGLGGSSEMSEITERAGAGDERAGVALDVYLHRLRSAIAAMAAAVGGLDVLAFTGGVGEHSAEVRRRAADGLGFLGVAVDDAQNEAQSPADRELSPLGAGVRTVVLRAREDLEIAAQTRAAMGAGGS